MVTGVVLAGGAFTQQLMPASLRQRFEGGAPERSLLVVAADSGADLAARLGIAVDLIVGDLDSVSPQTLAAARDAGAEIRRYPTDKDQTDLELAIDAAVDAGATELVVLGGAGGRFDHLLGNVGVIAAAAHRHRPASVEAWIGGAFVAVLDASARATWAAELPAGATLSVLAWSGDAVVSEGGVRWPLDRHVLAAGSALGVSNEALGGGVVVTVHEGSALVIIPEAEVLT